MRLSGYEVLDEYGLLVAETATRAQAERIVARDGDDGWEAVPVWELS